MNNLAVCYQESGRAAEAVPLQQEVLRLRRARMPPGHPAVLKATHNLAAAYQRAGRLAEALPLAEQALELQKAQLDSRPPRRSPARRTWP
jgi:tetratricopeptide (TPR) repeat protein